MKHQVTKVTQITVLVALVLMGAAAVASLASITTANEAPQPAVNQPGSEEDSRTKIAQATNQATNSAVNQLSDGYSYTVQPGDGVTHMLLDFARSLGEELTPSQAFEIAQDHGQQFLASGLTVPMDAPFTENIGGFPQPNVTLRAADYPDLFTDLEQAVVGTPVSDDAADDSGNQPSDDGSNQNETDTQARDNQQPDGNNQAASDTDEQQDDSDATDDETTADNTDAGDQNEDINWFVVIVVVGVAAAIYYVLSQRQAGNQPSTSSRSRKQNKK